MPNFLQYLDLSSNPIDICLVLDFVLLKNFNGHFFLRNRMYAKLHFSKRAFSQRFVNKEIRYLPQLTLLLFLVATWPSVWLDPKNKLFESLFLLLQLRQLVLRVTCSRRKVSTITICRIARVSSRSRLNNIEILITGAFRSATLHFKTWWWFPIPWRQLKVLLLYLSSMLAIFIV